MLPEPAVPTHPGGGEVREVDQCHKGWKTLCIQDETFKSPIIGFVQSRTECYISPVSFHRHVRSMPLSKWLDEEGKRKTNGDANIKKVKQRLRLTLPCNWIPSERMKLLTVLGGKRKFTDDLRAFDILATPTWLIVYALVTNCFNLRRTPKQAKETRRRAFHMLRVLARVACEAEVSDEVTVRTSQGICSINREGVLQGDLEWELKWATYPAAKTKTVAGDPVGSVITCLKLGQAEDDNRVGYGLVRARTLAGMIWLSARVCYKGVAKKASGAGDIAASLICFLSLGLAHWFSAQPEARTADLVAAQPGQSRTTPLLVHRLLQKKHPRRAVTGWKEDGIRSGMNVPYLEQRASTSYLTDVHSKLGPCTVLELLLDGTTFATKELNVVIAHSPQLNVSAYLPPFRGRSLRWRDGAAGTAITDTEWQRFLKTGFRTMPRMAIFDFLCELEHVLKAGLGKSLQDFQLANEFRVMKAGHVRYWMECWVTAVVSSCGSTNGVANMLGVPGSCSSHVHHRTYQPWGFRRTAAEARQRLQLRGCRRARVAST